ncbi:MAG: hypothetical protein FJY56_17580 [Betaproteobacteria bacterium]|nr:hypothetical protein [Betaproteobacteria bacterium]
MIYEVRTYTVKPRSMPEVVKRFGEKYEQRKKYSELTAFFQVEVGPLNTFMHIWGYKDLEERGKIRAAAVKDGAWPPPIAEFLVSQQSEILHPAPFAPEIKPSNNGPFFEWREYTHAAGQLPIMMKNWEVALPTRLEFGPITALWYSELGGLNKWIHVWPYKSLDQRNEVRDKAHHSGAWPPSARAKTDGRPIESLVAQRNMILTASSFSPTK